MGVFGPLPKDLFALLIGRASSSRAVLFILPGVIDSDYMGKSKIMAWTPMLPRTVPIAQLILLPLSTSNAGQQQLSYRGSARLGSSGLPWRIFWTQKVTTSQDLLTCKIQGCPFTALITSHSCGGKPPLLLVRMTRSGLEVSGFLLPLETMRVALQII